MGVAQANVVAVAREYAFDFMRFCLRNPRACPLLDVTEAGEWHPKLVCREDSHVDLRTDLPLYRVWKYVR